VEEIKTIDEDVHFALPKILQEALQHSWVTILQ
jgi:hypothetical protein